MRSDKLNLKDIKKDNKNIIWISLILCIFNLPIIIYSIIGKYSIIRFILIIVIIVFTQFYLAYLINRMIFIKHFKIIDNGKRIVCSDFRNKLIIVTYVFYVTIYYISLFIIMSNSYYSGSLSLININIINLLNIFNAQKIFHVYKGKKYFLYGDILIKNEEILYYDIKTIKKYKKDRRDKIRLTLHIKGGKDIVVYDSDMAYEIKEFIEEIYEERYIKEKMKEYGLEN